LLDLLLVEEEKSNLWVVFKSLKSQSWHHLWKDSPVV